MPNMPNVSIITIFILILIISRSTITKSQPLHLRARSFLEDLEVEWAQFTEEMLRNSLWIIKIKCILFPKSIREAVRTLDLIPLVALTETSNKELQHKEVIFSEAKWAEDMHMPKWDQKWTKLAQINRSLRTATSMITVYQMDI